MFTERKNLNPGRPGRFGQDDRHNCPVHVPIYVRHVPDVILLLLFVEHQQPGYIRQH